MAGKKPNLSNRAAYKQLLIAESELNRTLLLAESGAVAAGVQRLAERAKNLGTLASLAAFLTAGHYALRSSRTSPPANKRSWLSTTVNGLRKGAALWFAIRPKPGQRPGDHRNGNHNHHAEMPE